MFYNKMTEYEIEKPVEKRDAHGYIYATYEPCGTANIFITSLDTSKYSANDLQLLSKQFIAHTYNNELDTNWRISDGYNRYIVDYPATPRNGERVLYLTLLDKTSPEKPNPDEILPITYDKLDTSLQSDISSLNDVAENFNDGIDYDELANELKERIDDHGTYWSSLGD